MAHKSDTLAGTGGDERPALKIVQRRRPGDSQREQKELTRRKLLEAAQVVFRHYSYSETAVEQVADQAGVSRTTFYRHFEGKLPLALALFDDLAPRLKSTWKELFELVEPSSEDLLSWLEKLVKESSINQVLVSVFVQIEAIEPDAQANKFQYYENIWETSGFGSELREPVLEQLFAKFILMMLQVDQFLYLSCAHNPPISREHLAFAMAENIRSYLIEARGLIDSFRR